MTPKEQYFRDIKERGIKPDPAQALAVEATERLFHELINTPVPSFGIFDRLLKKTSPPIKGLYFWGDVGRGKTYILDNFYHCLPFAEKRRVHFNVFFRETHSTLQSLPKSPDPLKVIGARIAEKFRVLCIDEFHVDDITDAMIIAGLLDALFSQGVTLVTSSNIPVDELYKNGLQRERFLPAIDLLHQHTRVIQLQGETDFRRELLEKHGLYHIVHGQDLSDIIHQEFDSLVTDSELNKTTSLNNRPLATLGLSSDVVWIDFDEICNTPRSSSDYIELAKNFHTVLVSNIYPLNDGKNDIAQRFIQFIDALYDQSVKLIISATESPDKLYSGNGLKFPFQRTISRLYEMRSAEYLAQAHKG